MSNKFKTLPSNTTSQIPSSRASLPVLNGNRRRLINRPSQQSIINTEPLPNSPSPLHQVTTENTASSPQIPIAPPTHYLKKSASDLQRSSSPANLITTTQETANCLKGVTACLDIRTEDGDDVSQNFENALKSMGAKTRKTFADNVTHLIFKNGSAQNVKKALHNKCMIVNLLWITNCKSQGKRLPEDKYLIDNPENLVLAGSKRRKSMEPGRVKALVLDHKSSLEVGHRSENNTVSKRIKSPSITRSKIPASQKRKTISHWETSAIISRETTNSHHQSAAQKSDTTLDLDDLNFDFGVDTNETTPSERLQRQSSSNSRNGQPTLPLTISRSLRRLSFKEEPTTNERRPPPISQKPQVNKEIKAGFYIGKPQPTSCAPPSSSPSTTTSTSAEPSSSLLSASLPSLSSASPVVLRRRRRSLSNRAALQSSSSPFTTPSTITDHFPRLPDKSKSSPLSSPFLTPQRNDTVMDEESISNNKNQPTIVMTSMTEQSKKKCKNAIKKLGKYRLSSTVDETTTHVIVGCQRRTQSVLLGLLYGVWLVTPEWLLDSDTSNEYLATQNYEAILYFPRARAARRRDPLFPTTISIYINSTSLSLDLAHQFIIKAGGHVVNTLKEADIVISETPLDSDVMTVTENWLLDSIEHWRYLSMNRYHPPFA